MAAHLHRKDEALQQAQVRVGFADVCTFLVLSKHGYGVEQSIPDCIEGQRACSVLCTVKLQD